MATETEAAALLRVGAIYPKRLGLRDEAGRLIFAGVKRGAFSLYFDDEPIYHFDLDGRWQRAYIDGNHFRKALDQSVDLIGRARVPEGIALLRRSCPLAEIAGLDDAIRDVAIDVSVGLATGRFAIAGPPSAEDTLGVEELRDLLDRVASWDASAWFAMKERHLRVYRAAGAFIPPDAQNAIVLEPFDEEGRTRDPGDFASHCRDVARLLGLRAIQASAAFLEGVDSLRRPVEETISNLDAIASVFPIRDDPRPVRPRDLPPDQPSLSGVELMFEFLQGADGLPDPSGWKALAGRRVRRVTASFRLPGDRRDASESLAHAKAAGIAVSLVLPYGSDDPDREAASAEVVNALPLGRGDFVHLMGEFGGEASPDEQGSRRLPEIRAMLAPTRDRGVKVNDYNPAKQWS